MKKLEKYISKILPDDEKRLMYLSIFKEIILHANSFGIEKWGVHCQPRKIRLLVGNLIVASVHKNCLWLPIDVESLQLVSTEILNKFEEDWDTGKWGIYKSINSKNIYYSDDELTKWKILKPLHFKSIERAASKYDILKKSSRKNICYELIDYLNQLFNCSIPKPEKLKIPKGKNNILPKELKKIFELEQEMKDLTPKRVNWKEVINAWIKKKRR